MGCNGSKQATAAVAAPDTTKPKGDGELPRVGLQGSSPGEGQQDAKAADGAPAAASPASADSNLEVGDAATIHTTGEEVSVLKRTTTDILVKKSDGQEQWCEVENVSKAASAGFRVGDDAIVRSTSQRGSVLQRTTTDILIKTADGKEQWCDAEDIDKAPIATGAKEAASPSAQAEQPAETTSVEATVTQATPAEPAANKSLATGGVLGGLFVCCASSTAQ
eukprot:gnl/TRDRNA2_/TRDRNA2_181470_c0_seq1.p1 gnl/TRDRNA2_/TRDRNA2_181470_c0~~gnl/TRDRNA2_/TRDRNA2_181470_c0_seq1.p1  ORF type:complete len:221 (+),score=59.65 gnl/TRDRNA2_/TRDRNA2_181470_c0_seq1:68-730(+)